LRALSAFARARKDQVPFEFSKAAKHCQHQPPMRHGGIAPRITERFERCASLGDSSQGIQ